MSSRSLVTAPALELLAWVSAAPRTYRETIEAWRTSCPRLSTWEDAIADGLVRVVRDGAVSGPVVVLGEHGRAVLERAGTVRPEETAART